MSYSATPEEGMLTVYTLALNMFKMCDAYFSFLLFIFNYPMRLPSEDKSDGRVTQPKIFLLGL